MEKVSIIVPIHNVEKYIERCTKSLISQTYRDIEILLINDGSPDNSKTICERYEKIDKRIKLYNKENGGLSDARNYGLKRAKGEYILFVDSDDYIESNTVEVLISEMKKDNLDIVAGNAVLEADGEDKWTLRVMINAKRVKFILRNAKKTKTKIKLLIFLISKKLYRKLKSMH